MPEQENADSETSINMSSRSVEPDPNETTITTAKTEHMEAQYVYIVKLLSFVYKTSLTLVKQEWDLKV